MISVEEKFNFDILPCIISNEQFIIVLLLCLFLIKLFQIESMKEIPVLDTNETNPGRFLVQLMQINSTTGNEGYHYYFPFFFLLNFI